VISENAVFAIERRVTTNKAATVERLLFVFIVIIVLEWIIV
jgi:hypothetical protein